MDPWHVLFLIGATAAAIVVFSAGVLFGALALEAAGLMLDDLGVTRRDMAEALVAFPLLLAAFVVLCALLYAIAP